MGFKGKSGLGAGLHLSAMPGHISKRSNDINMEISAKNIWDQRALNSEIEFSRALLSEPIEYPDFIHMVNLHVAWCGDFNRALKVKFTDFLSFERIVAQVEQIHHEKGLDRPDRYDISEPELDDRLWCDYLQQKGYRLQTAIFFNALTRPFALPGGYSLYSPSCGEYFNWYAGVVKSHDYYDEDWFKQHFPLKANFILVFKPYWLLHDETLIGWVYSANLGEYCRLFEVEIEERFRGQGMGKVLMQAILHEGYKQGVKHALLQTGDRLRPFYESCGFRECSRNSIIRLNK